MQSAISVRGLVGVHQKSVHSGRYAVMPSGTAATYQIYIKDLI